MRGLGLDRGRISLASGRDSDIRPRDLPEDDTDTFVFTVPPRDVSEEREPSLAGDSPIRQDDDNEEVECEDDMDAIDAEEPEPSSPRAAGADITMQDSTIGDVEAAAASKSKAARKKKFKISKHGIQYPSLPAGVVKKLATTFARTSGNSKVKINKETLDAIMQASDWFFEQVSDDLGAYAQHAGRKTIDESDIVTLMGRYVSPPDILTLVMI